jgi:hypothetical protein
LTARAGSRSLGIASIDVSFGQSNNHPYGVYHSELPAAAAAAAAAAQQAASSLPSARDPATDPSPGVYDSYTWLETQVDPQYEYHAAMARVMGLLVLDFSDSAVLPIDTADVASALAQYAEQIEHKAHALDMSPVRAAIETFAAAADKFEQSKGALPDACANLVLARLERAFLDPQGLPRRKWFRHVLQAPGFFLGYAAEVLPGLQEALTLKDEALFARQVLRVADVIHAAARVFALAGACDASSAAADTM